MASLLTIDVMNLLVRSSLLRIASTYNSPYTQRLLDKSKPVHSRVLHMNGLTLHAPQTNGAVRPIVRKKAATCLLRLIRKSPPEAEILQPDVWSVKLVRCQSGRVVACFRAVLLSTCVITRR